MTVRRAAVWGLGKAGGSLVASLLQAGVDVVAVGSRSAARRGAFRRRLRASSSAKVEVEARDVLSLAARAARAGADALFLAVPDDALDETAALLREGAPLPRVVAHLSGARGGEALAALSPRVVTASFHPLAALDGRAPIPAGCLLAVDAATKRAAQELAALARRLSLVPVRVDPGERARYHAGAVVSANLAVALLSFGTDLVRAAGVDRDVARRGLARLLLSTAQAAIERPLEEMMTGPVARGDVRTVERHLAILEGAFGDPALAPVYRALSARLVDVARLPPARKRALRAALGARPRR